MTRGGGIRKISDLFETYKKRFRAPEGTVTECFREIVEEIMSLKLGAGDVAYNPQSRTLIVRAPGPVRSEIFLHKEEILAHLKGRLGVKNTPEHII